MSGVISGGWGYVIAAWGIGFGVLAIYVGSLWARSRRIHRGQETSDE